MDKQQFIDTFLPAFTAYCEEWADQEQEDTEPAKEFANTIVQHAVNDEALRVACEVAADTLRRRGVQEYHGVALLQVMHPLRSTYFKLVHKPHIDCDTVEKHRLIGRLFQAGMELWLANYSEDTVPWYFTTVTQEEVDFYDIPVMGPYGIDDLHKGMPAKAVQVLKEMVADGVRLYGGDCRSGVCWYELQELVEHGNLIKELKDGIEGLIYDLTQVTEAESPARELADMLDWWHTLFVYDNPHFDGYAQ